MGFPNPRKLTDTKKEINSVMMAIFEAFDMTFLSNPDPKHQLDLKRWRFTFTIDEDLSPSFTEDYPREQLQVGQFVVIKLAEGGPHDYRMVSRNHEIQVIISTPSTKEGEEGKVDFWFLWKKDPEDPVSKSIQERYSGQETSWLLKFSEFVNQVDQLSSGVKSDFKELLVIGKPSLETPSPSRVLKSEFKPDRESRPRANGERFRSPESDTSVEIFNKSA